MCVHVQFEYQQAQLEAEVENLSWKVERAEITDRGVSSWKLLHAGVARAFFGGGAIFDFAAAPFSSVNRLYTNFTFTDPHFLHT